MEDVRFEAGEAAGVRLKPNLPRARAAARQAAARRSAPRSTAGRYELDGDDVLVEGERLSGDDVLRERTPVNEGWVVAAEGEVERRARPRARRRAAARAAACYELIHAVNSMRARPGPRADRPHPADPAARRTPTSLERHADWIKQETLAVAVEADGAETPRSRACSRRPLALDSASCELAAELDRQPEGDVLVDHPERLDARDAARAEPVADALDEPLGSRGAGGDADHLDAVEPAPRRSRSRRRSDGRRRRRPARPRRAGSSSRSCASRSRAGGRSRRSISLTAHCRLEVA